MMTQMFDRLLMTRIAAAFVQRAIVLRLAPDYIRLTFVARPSDDLVLVK